MSRKETSWGAFDNSLRDEIDKMIEYLKNSGVENPTKLEATALIAKKSKMYKLTNAYIIEFIKNFRMFGGKK